MKNLFLAIIVAVLFQSFLIGQNYYNYGPSREQNNNGGSIGVNPGPPTTTYFDFSNWQWTDNNIPILGVLDSINIKFKATESGALGANRLHFTFHYIEKNWSQFDASYYSNQIQYNNNRLVFDDTITCDGYGAAYYNRTITSGKLFDSIKTAISSGKYYITLGMRSEGTGYPYWNIYPFDGIPDNGLSIDLTFYFKTNNQSYQFVNNIENAETYGTLTVKNNSTGSTSTINSGSSLLLDPKYIFSSRTNVLPFITNYNSTGYTEKHNYWVASSSNNYLLTYSFRPNLNNISAKLTAKFDRTSPAIIQTSLSEGGSGGAINFYDPWRYYTDSQGNWLQNNSFNSYSSPFSIQNNSSGSYGGIILNQGGSPSWTPPYYSVSTPSSQTIPINGVNHTFYLLNWTTTNATVQNSTSAQTPVVFTSTGATVTANLKGTQLSSITSAYANNSQRKFVRTTDGYLHMVYESIGHVWYEMSTNNGSTWTIMNGGKPLDSGGGKLPSIDYANFTTGNKVAIVYEQQAGNIALFEFYASGGTYVLGVSTTISTGDSYSDNINPTIAWSNNSAYMVTWEGKTSSVNPGINFKIGSLDNNTFLQSYSGIISGTDGNSTNTTIYINKLYPGITAFNMAWQQNSTSSSSIYWCVITYYTNGTIASYTTSNISSGDGCVMNYRPSIFETSDGGARVCWIGDVTGTGTTVETVFKDPQNSRFWYFGYNVASTSINATDDNSAYYVAWSQNTSGTNYVNEFTDSGTLSHISTVNTTGKDIQLCNGASKSAMYVSSFSPFTAPYFFTTSNNLNTFAKANANAINSGRGGVVSKGDAQFFYKFGDLTVDNNNIDFVKAADTVKYNNLNEINNVTVTNPFTINNNSTFEFSECSGVLDSLAAISILGDSSYVSFKDELIDNTTNNVVGTIRELKFTSSNLHPYSISSYNLSTEGLGGKTVKVRITINTDIDNIKTALTDSYADANSISKTNSKSITLQGSEVIKEYALNQNYPNPFNPTTIISYQIPKDGLVTVKIYDILGNEVKTLANGYKTIGKYSVSFDASRLASGVYFYQLRSNGFVSTKKMMLLK